MQSINQVFARKTYKTLSPLEQKVVYELLEYPVRFESNFPVGKYFIDIAFPKYKLGLEIDGKDYHSTDEQVARDELRQEYLETVEGWKIERIPGWFCYRYPDVSVTKALRHIPELKNNARFKNACLKAKQWYARDLLNTGQSERAIRILSDLSK